MLTTSFSKLKDFEECSYRVKLQHIDKLPRETNEFAERGNVYHKAIEDYIVGATDEIKLDINFDHSIIHQYRSLRENDARILVEQKWGFDRAWRPVDFWENPWLRVVCDVVYIDGTHAEIVDWKTGKKSEVKHRDQGHLYACAAFSMFPELTSADIKFHYLDQDDSMVIPVNRELIRVFRDGYQDRLLKLSEAESFIPKPNKWRCRWCSMQKHCEYAFEEDF